MYVPGASPDGSAVTVSVAAVVPEAGLTDSQVAFSVTANEADEALLAVNCEVFGAGLEPSCELNESEFGLNASFGFSATVSVTASCAPL